MRAYEKLLNDRSEEVKSHLALISELTAAAIARQGIANLPRIEIDHVHVLKSGFLVHLYNVVEAVMAQILDEVSMAVVKYPPASWSSLVRTEWVRSRAGVGRGIESQQRLLRTVAILNETISGTVDGCFRITHGGNWSDAEIEKVSSRLGCPLLIAEDVINRACRYHFQDNFAPMKFVRRKRNLLAHGNETFQLSARALSPIDLERLRESVVEYMKSVSRSFTDYLDAESFLQVNAA